MMVCKHLHVDEFQESQETDSKLVRQCHCEKYSYSGIMVWGQQGEVHGGMTVVHLPCHDSMLLHATIKSRIDLD